VTEDPADRDAAGVPDGESAPDEEPPTVELADRMLSVDEVQTALQALGQPVATADQLARKLDATRAAVGEALDDLAGATEALERLDVAHDPVVYYPRAVADLARTERVVPFPSRREIVVDQPTQFTRARLSQFARLVEADQGRYLYEIRPEDVWGAPYDSLERLLETVRAVLPERAPALEGWIGDQWARAGKFRLVTHEDGYVVLEAESEALMGNVARPKFEDGQLRAPISDSESWVAEEAIAEVKRTLYEAGYPVRDDRDLESGDPVEFEVELELREYQRDWVERFLDAGSGILVGPPGSGKTVAAMAIAAEIGGETLILVPSRELAAQWREELLARTTLSPDQVGEYHGGEKTVRPITIATYHVAGMDRHRQLFDSREWGLLLMDECHHIPAPVFRRSADLQSRHRLGLTATPVREGDDEADIYTLIGPPIGTDWDALFDAGYVAEPEIELRFVPWPDDGAVDRSGAIEREQAVEAGSEPDAATAEAATAPDDEPAAGGDAADEEAGDDEAGGAHAGATEAGTTDAGATETGDADADAETAGAEEAGSDSPTSTPETPSTTARDEYVASHGHDRRQAAATNPAKVRHVRDLLAEHPGQKALVFVDYLEQGRAIAEAIDVPFLSGETPHAERERLLSRFRTGELDRLVVSRVGDEGIDLPEAEIAIVASGLGGSRRQGAQRAGRTMRPAGKAQVYVLATRGTEEEDFARQRTRHLAGKGVRVREVHVEERERSGTDSGDGEA